LRGRRDGARPGGWPAMLSAAARRGPDRRVAERRAVVRTGGGRRRTPAYQPSLLRAFSRDLLDTGVLKFDAALLWVVAILLAIGLVMVYSASIAVLERRNPGGG